MVDLSLPTIPRGSDRSRMREISIRRLSGRGVDPPLERPIPFLVPSPGEKRVACGRATVAVSRIPYLGPAPNGRHFIQVSRTEQIEQGIVDLFRPWGCADRANFNFERVQVRMN